MKRKKGGRGVSGRGNIMEKRDIGWVVLSETYKEDPEGGGEKVDKSSQPKEKKKKSFLISSRYLHSDPSPVIREAQKRRRKTRNQKWSREVPGMVV